MRNGLLVMALALGSSCACGPGPGPDDGGLPLDGSVSVADVPDIFLTDLCQALIQCHGWQYCSVADCRRDQTVLGLFAFEAELDAGWLRYDPAAMYACHRRFSGDPCGFGFFSFTVPTVTQVLAACPGTVEGLRTVGQTCASIADCVAGSACVTDNRTCPGTCLALLPRGAPCTVGSGAWCEQGTNCSGGTCKGGGEPGTACSTSSDCKSFSCQADAGVCMGPAKLGEACTWLGNSMAPACGPMLRCNDHFTVGVCLTQSAASEPCFETHDCQSGLVCGPSGDAGFGNGRCTSPLPANSACGQQTLTDCAAGLFCGGATGARTCRPLRGQGEPCETFYKQCSPGLDCAVTDGGVAVCLARRCLGQACDDGVGQCGDVRCQGGSCVPNPPPADNTCSP